MNFIFLLWHHVERLNDRMAVTLVFIIIFCFVIPFVFLFLNYKQHIKHDMSARKKSKWRLFFLPPK